ncbi:MAG: invasion associated locus B family protein [Paracoccaceae bacterium]
MTTHRMSAFAAAALAGAGLLAAAPGAGAQEADAAAPTGAPPAQRELVTTATHGDWDIVCVDGEAPCVMRQNGVTADGQRALEMSVRRVEPQQTEQGTVESVLTIVTPLNVLLRQGLTLQVDAAEPTTGQYTICTNEGCTLTEPAPNVLIDQLKRGAEAKLSFVYVQGQQAGQVDATVSLNGFTAAWNALAP